MACGAGREGDFVLKYTFRRVPLMTVMLEHLIENQNVKGSVVGVFPGDVHPEVDNEPGKLKWIWNTDPALKPGRHWILCILHKSFEEEYLKEGICKIYKYKILDSWNPWFVSSAAIMDSISSFFQKRCRDHSDFSSENWTLCNCKLSVVSSSIKGRIQHLNYTTCGWFALYFCTFLEDCLKEWLKTKVKYGSIKG